MKFEWNSSLQVAFDIAAINISWFFALVLRFDGSVPEAYIHAWWVIALVMTVMRLFIFICFRLYQNLWTFTSLPEVYLVFKTVTISTIIIWVLVLTAQNFSLLPFPTPKAIGIIDWLLNIISLSGIRYTVRLRREWLTHKLKNNELEPKKLLIVGAGEAGSMIVREILRHFDSEYMPVGFIDDNPQKKGRRLHGFPVLGSRHAIPEVIKQYGVKEVIIALPSASRHEVREILEFCQQETVHVRIVPHVAEIIKGTVSIKQLRDVVIEDLLEREPVNVDLSVIAGYLTGERVMVTGAGGSIGAELCRQILQFKPGLLILLGRGENSIYEIDQELGVKSPTLKKIPLVADVKDRAKLKQIFELYRPTVVFHAAAHKHVPLMEQAPDEAVKNNVFGTRNLAELAAEYRCKRFVLISTDKAVNPTSVMGVTKRVAELVIQDLNNRSETKFMAVRFGNVLGSRGSVIPLFRSQIARGGPVTVTHPEMTRFFMTIPEAVQLVIQAGALGQGGEVFILDMGEPVNIAQLARKLIKLSGYTPDKDIKIVYNGVRPGEKMYEELLTMEEGLRSTRHERIFVSQVQGLMMEVLAERLKTLEKHLGDERKGILTQLQKLAPEYRPWLMEESAASTVTVI